MRLFFFSFLLLIFAFFSYFYIDKNLALFFYEHTPKTIHHIFKEITKLGLSEWYILGGGIVYFVCKNSDKIKSRLGLFLALSVIISGIIVDIIKVLVARYRPKAFLHDGLYGFKGFDIGYIVNSFPSGHSATAFSAFVAFSFIFPKYKYLFFFIAFIVAFSRVVLYHHYLSDVIVGSLIGGLTSVLLYKRMFSENRL